MAKYVLLSDLTLMHDYRDFPLLDFLPCAPSDMMPGFIYRFLQGSESPPMENGEVLRAPYAIRKVEAGLLRDNKREDVVVPHMRYLENFIKEDTEVIGITTMDPLGFGPLTMSYSALFGTNANAWVRKEWEQLLTRVAAARKGKKAKVVVGGPGVWEFTLAPEELDRFGVDYAYQGEADDIVSLLFEQISRGDVDKNLFFRGYMTYDDNFVRSFKGDERFLSRRAGIRMYPTLEDIPDIVRPTTKNLTEVMRGCGVGCDFCEVTLRPLRYYPIEKVIRELSVNAKVGSNHSWLHSDEIFAYKHGTRFTPNEDALIELFKAVVSTPGIKRTNPTHGRISIPAAYPELILKLTKIIDAGPSHWIGVQVGLETGSDRLAKIHMPNKTLPLSIGPDGSWEEIVWEGVRNMNVAWWRPAFTVQVGQRDETDEDNWDTVAMINRLSESYYGDRPFEFTVTPMQNVPLGLIKSREFSRVMLTPAQLAVYYASYRHLAKMAQRDAYESGKGWFLGRLGASSLIAFGGRVMLRVVEGICRKHGLDTEKVKNYGLNGNRRIESIHQLIQSR
jgi:radical SAM superfamily enzyme YgiQ (UPF0313 family)